MLLKSKYIQTSQINLSTLKSYAFKQKKNKKKHLQQPNAASDTSNTLKFQNANPSRSTPQPHSNQNLHAWTHNLLEVNRTKDKIAQKITHTQRHMNNDWNEMVLCSPCFAFITFLLLLGFTQTIWGNSYCSKTNYVA